MGNLLGSSSSTQSRSSDDDIDEFLSRLMVDSRPTERVIAVSPPEGNEVVCTHYESGCLLICPEASCGKKYPCTTCHDRNVRGHRLNGYRVKKIACKNCDSEQNTSIMCETCDTVFGKYFCEICNIFDDRELGYYHCFDCRKCRTGGPDNNFHCFQCETCLSLSSLRSHSCLNGDGGSDNCPICFDDMNHPDCDRTAMPCGHTIHSDCFRRLQNSSAPKLCPVCRQPL